MVRPRELALAVVGLLVLVVVVVVMSRSGATPACQVGSLAVEPDVVRRAATAVGDASLPAAEQRLRGRVPDDAVVPLARALTGHDPAALTCRVDPTLPMGDDRLRQNGLTARADAVLRDVRRTWSASVVPAGGFAPGGVSTGHMPGSAHYEGRAVDLFFRPVSAANQVRGWALAQYLVANADRLRIATVIFDARIWTRSRSDEGWRPYRVATDGDSRRTRQILEHRDHVHVDCPR